MLFRRKNKSSSVALPPLTFCTSDIEGLRRWANDLPKNNAMQLAQDLLSALQELTYPPLSTEQLSAIVHTLEPEITDAAEGLAASQPSKIKRIENYQLQQQFFSQFGQLLLRNFANFSHNKTPTNITHLTDAVTFLARAIAISNKLYSDAPIGCWQALHRSYMHLQRQVNSKNNATEFIRYYKASIALNCLSPQQVNLSTLDLLFDFLLETSQLINISSKPNTQTSFEVKLTEDFAPQKYDLEKSEHSEQVDSLSAYINLELLLDACTQGSQHQAIKQHLSKVLYQAAIRQTERKDASVSFDICAGIFSIHQEISGKQTLEQFVGHFSNTTVSEKLCFITKDTSLPNKPNDIWSNAYLSTLSDSNKTNVIEFGMRSVSEAKSKKFSQDVTCVDAVNCSLTGLCIRGDSLPLTDFTPGTLIGLQQKGDPHWSIAGIRWARAHQDQRKLGIEIIGNNISPCAIKIIHSKQGTDFLPAMQIPHKTTKASLQKFVSHSTEQNNDSNLDWVLFPNTGLNTKASAILLSGGEEQRIMLDDCIERSSEYCIYALHVIGQETTV